MERYRRNEVTAEAEREQAEAVIQAWRRRLCDVSWFMRGLNEHLARRANEEDGCKGRFWEGRFKSQALLDEAAVLTCMSYVDLNPVRAGVADTPEESDFTSIQQRTQELGDNASSQQSAPEQAADRPKIALTPLNTEDTDPHPNAFGFADYLELLDWTGRAVRDDKRGAIDSGIPPILERLGLDPEGFLNQAAGRTRLEHR